MMALFRDGFWKDWLILILASILVGTVLSAGVARAVDSYFGDTIDGLIGEYGEYDLILHLREEAREAGIQALEELIAKELPGAVYKEGVTIAGKANIFISLPPELETKERLQSIRSTLYDIPGSAGMTMMIQPSVVIQGVHPGFRSQIISEVEQIPGVRLVFRDSDNLYVLLNSVEDNQRVSEAVRKIINRYEILEVRFPIGYEVEDIGKVTDQIMDVLRETYEPRVLENVTLENTGDAAKSFIKTLSEMKTFLLNYASKVTIPITGLEPLHVGNKIVLQGSAEEPLNLGDPVGAHNIIVEITDIGGGEASGVIIQGDISDVTPTMVRTGYKVTGDNRVGRSIGEVNITNERYQLIQTIDESMVLLDELEALASSANETVANAEETLRTFEQALIQLEQLQQQIRQLNSGIAGNESVPGSLVISLLMDKLFRSLTGTEGETDLTSLQNLDIQAMKESLADVAARINAVQSVDIEAVIEQIRKVKDSLPDLRDEEIGQSINLIDSYIAGEVIPGDQIQLVLDKGVVKSKEAEKLIQEALDNRYATTFTMPVAVVNPDARAELIRVLQEVRAIIAGLLAVVFSLGSLVLDHASVFSTIKRILAQKRAVKGWRRIFDPVKLLGTALGTVLLLSIYRAAGAEIPLLNLGHIGILGALLGLMTAAFCEKFSPVDVDEMMAGQALGLPYVQIMREIVIPSGRPGLMYMLNRRRQRFK
ncbi:MAG TPA: hypothetical protein GXX47_04335 [Firmicutes bacterium]|nr:hypothetical protein [Bacillota bacterium]